MSKLTEHKGEQYRYYTNNKGYQGEYKEWHFNGGVETHCFWKDGKLHGEYKWWGSNGQLGSHRFFQNDNDITKEVKELVDDISNITDEERMMIKLKFGIECLC